MSTDLRAGVGQASGEETAAHAAVVVEGADYGDWACCGGLRAAAVGGWQRSRLGTLTIAARLTSMHRGFDGLLWRFCAPAAQCGPAGDSSSGAGERMAHRAAVMFMALAPAAVRVWLAAGEGLHDEQCATTVLADEGRRLAARVLVVTRQRLWLGCAQQLARQRQAGLAAGV